MYGQFTYGVSPYGNTYVVLPEVAKNPSEWPGGPFEITYVGYDYFINKDWIRVDRINLKKHRMKKKPKVSVELLGRLPKVSITYMMEEDDDKNRSS